MTSRQNLLPLGKLNTLQEAIKGADVFIGLSRLIFWYGGFWRWQKTHCFCAANPIQRLLMTLQKRRVMI